MRASSARFLFIAVILAATGACSVRVAEDVPVEMRDGIHLLTDVYLPPRGGPFPVILTRTPYDTTSPESSQSSVGQFFAQGGFAFIAQKVRGRCGSEGTFAADGADHDIADAYDTVDWIVAQEWSNGIVGVMAEPGYGSAVFAAAASGHTAIKAISTAAATMTDEARVSDGALPLQDRGLWTLRMDAAPNEDYQDISSIDLYHLPLITMGEAQGLRDVLWRDLIDGYLDDPATLREKALEEYEKIRVPALHFGGWYEPNVRGTIADWEGVKLYSGDADASDRQWLVIGPWDRHSMSIQLSDLEPPTNIGRRNIGSKAASSYADALLEFFTYFLKREDNGFIDLPRVQYFNIGGNDCRYSERWPPQDSRLRSLYFHSTGKAGSAHDGSLDFVPPGDEPADAYVYDPRHPVTLGRASAAASLAATLPDRSGMAMRDDVLTFETGPLLNDLDVTGSITVDIYATSSAPDTDFTAALVDVYPDGYGLLIQEGILRASFRDRTAPPSPIERGRVYAFTIDLSATSYVVPALHRIRVEISSSNFPRFARNLNNGEPFGTSDRIEVAQQTIYHSSRYPSRLVLPVISK